MKKQELIEIGKKYYKDTGEIPAAKKFTKKAGYCSRDWVYKEFGSWPAFLKELGFNENNRERDIRLLKEKQISTIVIKKVFIKRKEITTPVTPIKEYLVKAIKPYIIYKNICSKEELINACLLEGKTNVNLGLPSGKYTSMIKYTFPNKPKSITVNKYLLTTLNKKWCPTCKTVKNYDEFHKNKSSNDRFSYSCKKCRLKQQSSYYYRNPEAQNSRVRKRESNLDRALTQEEIICVFERDSYKCQLCDYENEEHNIDYGTNLHLDHIIPHTKGGLTVISNIQLLCRSCNTSKGNR